MPIFEYECKTCGERFEALVFGSEQPECPACKGSDLKKLFSSFAVASGEQAPGCPAGPDAAAT